MHTHLPLRARQKKQAQLRKRLNQHGWSHNPATSKKKSSLPYQFRIRRSWDYHIVYVSDIAFPRNSENLALTADRE